MDHGPNLWVLDQLTGHGPILRALKRHYKIEVQKNRFFSVFGFKKTSFKKTSFKKTSFKKTGFFNNQLWFSFGFSESVFFGYKCSESVFFGYKFSESVFFRFFTGSLFSVINVRIRIFYRLFTGSFIFGSFFPEFY
jgi:hypothetical protein